MPLYMKTTPVINGDVTDDNYANWISLTHVDWDCKRDKGSQVGPAASRKAPAPEVAELTIRKHMDRASPKLIGQSMQTSTCMSNVEIDLVHASPTGSYTFAVISLDNVLVLSYDVDADAEEDEGNKQPVETLKLNFTKITFKYIQLSALGKPESPIMVTYDMSTTPPKLS